MSDLIEWFEVHVGWAILTFIFLTLMGAGTIITVTTAIDHHLPSLDRIEHRLERKEYRHAASRIKLYQKWGRDQYDSYGTLSEKTIDRLTDKGYTVYNEPHESHDKYDKYYIKW